MRRRRGRRWRAEVRAGVCVVGAGFTGLSAALELAERGHDVVVVEAARVGWGASGRNGGQIVNGLNAGLETIGRRYGRATAEFVATVAQEGGRIIRERVARYGIDCDLKDGNLFAAFTPAQMRALEAKQALWRRLRARQLRDARPGGDAAARRERRLSRGDARPQRRASAPAEPGARAGGGAGDASAG